MVITAVFESTTGEKLAELEVEEKVVVTLAAKTGSSNSAVSPTRPVRYLPNLR